MGKITIDEEEAKRIVREAMENYPEASSDSLECIQWNYKEMKFTFTEDTGTSNNLVKHDLNEEMLIKGLNIFVELVLRGEYHNNNFQENFMDVGNWDATDFDALVQCALFGKIIYG